MTQKLPPLILVLGLLLGACSSTPQTQNSLRPPSEESLAAFLEYSRAYRFDYEPAVTPSDLAEQAEVVVAGTIVDVNPGQSYAPTPESDAVIATSVLQVKVDEVLAGDSQVVAEGSVYIEIAHPAFVSASEEERATPFDHEAFAATVPRTYGLFFLDDRTDEPYWNAVLDEGAGRPSGARLTAPFVQGFLIEGAQGKIVSVLEPLELMPSAWHDLASVQALVDELDSLSN